MSSESCVFKGLAKYVFESRLQRGLQYLNLKPAAFTKQHGVLANEAIKPLIPIASNIKAFPATTADDVEIEHLRPAYITPQASYSTEYRGRESELPFSALE